jgi:hypothetical protein
MRILATLLAVSLAGAAAAAEPSGAVTMASLPEQVRELMERQYGEMGDAGAPFSPWCVRAPGTYHARLVSIEREAERLLVRFERGGIAGALTRLAEYRMQDGAWTEIGKPPPPPVTPPPVKWTGQPRSFGNVLDTVLPPLDGAVTPPFARLSP